MCIRDSAIAWPISIKFYMAQPIPLPKLMCKQKFENFKIHVDRRRPTRKLRIISISFYSLPKKQRKNSNNRFHAKLVKYWNFYDIFADVWRILMKFCMMTHISYSEHNSCSKSHIWKKIQDGGCCRLKKIVKCDISAIVSLILIKFAATMHISNCKFNSESVHS